MGSAYSLTIKNMKSAIESILFASGDAVNVERLAEIFGTSKKDIKNVMEELIEKFEQDESGIRILKLENSFQMCSKTENSSYVKEALDMRRRVPLSQAAMEVLSIIAYNQPVTKSFVEQVRGVDSSSIVNSLVEKYLIEERGRLELPGRPVLYGTTHNFLRCFGIQSVDDLPQVNKKSVDFSSEETT